MAHILTNLIYYGSYLIFPLIFLLIWQVDKKKFSLEIIFLLVIVFAFIWMRFLEPNLLVVKNYDFGDQEQDNKLKVVVFSDIHIGVYNKKILLERAVEKIKKIDPDLVLIPGDFVYQANLNKLESDFSCLTEIQAPKLAVLGNHDHSKRGNFLASAIIKSLEKNNVIVIDNQIKNLEIKRQKIEFVGLADIWTAEPDFSVVVKQDGEEENSSFRFLLSHNPDSIYNLNEYELAENESRKKINLMISGHTHAGQVRLPFIYKQIIPSKYGFNKGFYNIKGTDIFVTPGIGNVVLPFRLFNPPEISVLNISY